MMSVKDFATKKTRMTGKQEVTLSDSIARVPIGRWVLLGFVVIVMVGYAIWSHHKEFSEWLFALGHHRSSLVKPAINSPNPVKTPAKNDLNPPPVQFDFYHVLANDSGKGEAAVELVSSSSAAAPDSTTSSSQDLPNPTNSENSESVERSASPAPSTSAITNPPVSQEPQAPPLVKPVIKAPIKPSIKPLVPKSAPAMKLSPPVKTLKPTAKTVTKTEVYQVQVSSFSSKDKAESLRAKLMLLGFEPKVSNGSNGHYLVYFPSTKNEHTAEALRHQLSKLGVNSSIAVASINESDSHAE
jgi:cell division protein FtsN